MTAEPIRHAGTVSAKMRWLAPLLTAAACLLMWEAAVDLFSIPIYLLPPPSDVLVKMFSGHQMFLAEAIPTVTAIVCGFLLAVAVGVPIATFMVYLPLFRYAVHGILITAQVLPKVALAPLFIVWFGFGLLPKVLMTFLIAFFPIVIDSMIGLASVRPESLMLVRSMGGNRWQAFWKIRLPNALPSMFGGFKVAITFAVVGALVAEFVGSDSGLGYVLVMARGNLDTLTVFAVIGWLVVIGFFFYYLVEFLEKLVLRNRAHQRAHELGAGL
jgi:NitT/TauT family transport system permease protein